VAASAFTGGNYLFDSLSTGIRPSFTRVENISFQNRNTNGSCIRIATTITPLILSCSFNPGVNGIGINFDPAVGNLYFPTVMNCYFTGVSATDGSIGVNGAACNVYGCNFVGLGIGVNWVNSGQGGGVWGSRFEVNGTGIISNSNGCIISGNQTESNLVGFQISGPGSVVMGNFVSGPSAVGSRGIWVSGGKGSVVMANIISGPFSIAALDISQTAVNAVAIGNTVANGNPNGVIYKTSTNLANALSPDWTMIGNNNAPITSTFALLPVPGFNGGAATTLGIGEDQYWCNDSKIPANAPPCNFTASIASSTLTVSAIGSGALYAGDPLYADVGATTALLPGTQIISQLTGTLGSTGTYQLNLTYGSPVSSEAMFTNGRNNWGVPLAIGGGTQLVKLRMAAMATNPLAALGDGGTQAWFQGSIGVQFGGSITSTTLNVTSWLRNKKVSAKIDNGSGGAGNTLTLSGWDTQAVLQGYIIGQGLHVTAVTTPGTPPWNGLNNGITVTYRLFGANVLNPTYIRYFSESYSNGGRIDTPQNVGGSTIASGTYNSGTGVVSLTLAAMQAAFTVGASITVQGVTGSGADIGLVNGTQTVTSATTTNVQFNVGTGKAITITSNVAGAIVFAAQALYAVPLYTILGFSALPVIGETVADGGAGGVAAGTTITGITQEWNGQTGIYTVSGAPQNAANGFKYIFPGTLVPAQGGYSGDTLAGGSITAGTTVTAAPTPWNGVSGSYTVNTAQTTGAIATITASSNVVNCVFINSGAFPSTTCKFGVNAIPGPSQPMVRNLVAQLSGAALGVGLYQFDGAAVSGATGYTALPLNTATKPTAGTGIMDCGAGNAGTVMTLFGTTTNGLGSAAASAFQVNMIGCWSADAVHNRFVIGSNIDATHWNMTPSNTYLPPGVFIGGLWAID
jgi:hypothetical protein